MFTSETDRRLYRLFKGQGGPRPEHKAELEKELMEKFDERALSRRKVAMSKVKSVLFRRAIVISAAAVIAGAGACVAPADVDVGVGHRVYIRYDASIEGAPNPREVVDLIKGHGPPGDARVRIKREGTKVAVHADLWGSEPLEGPLADTVRRAFPALKDAVIEESSLHGKVRGTIGEKIGHDLLDLDLIDAADVENAKQQVMAQLAARGVEGTVDVQVESDGSKRKVMIRVEKQGGDPPEGAAPAVSEEPASAGSEERR
jgi:hypothetical protein